MTRSRFIIAIVLAALLQTALLLWIVVDRIRLLTTGQEIVLQTEPVDPRSLFQGDYVILSYSISQIPLKDIAVDRQLDDGDEIYVTLVPNGDTWKPIAIHHQRPDLTDGQAALKGRVDYVWQDREGETPGTDCPECMTAQISYGLESYFVPEGTGRQLEEFRNERALKVIVAVNEAGDSAIKGLVIDGETIYEEPLL